MADANHETKITISGDDSGAQAAFKRITGAVAVVRTQLNRLMRVFGLFGMAVQGVQAAINAIKWLKDKITETSREIAKMRFDFAMRQAANETSRLVGLHEKLARLMKDELDTMSKQRTLDEIEAGGKKDEADGRRAADRARQIFEAKSPAEEQALRDKFAAEDEQMARDARKEQRKQRIRQLDEEDSVYTSKAKALRRNNSEISQQIEAEQFNLLRAGENEDYQKEIHARIDALQKRKAANDAEIEQFEKEAKFRRDQIAALESQKDYEGPTAGEWERKTRAKKQAEEEAREKAKAQKAEEEKQQRQAQREADRQQQEENRKTLEQANTLSAFADRAASADAVSQNRLTAMGLGSGVSGSGGVASDVKRLVDLLRQNVEATKNIKLEDGDNIAVYGA